MPEKIEEGGAWTLQRLGIETHPQPLQAEFGAAAPVAADSAQVLQRVTIEALNITVLKGSGQEIVNWCAANNFILVGDTRAHRCYAEGSPIFMAAKFNTSAVKARHQVEGDGTPILITMRTAHPWVPLEVLALDGQQVQADLYMLTDEPLNTSDIGAVGGQSPVGTEVPGAPGLNWHLGTHEYQSLS